MQNENPLRIIPEEKIKNPQWVIVLLFFSIFLFVGLIGTLLYLKGQTPSLKAEKESLTSQVNAIDDDVLNQSAEKSLRATAKQLKDFSSIFKERKLGTTFFEFLKTIVHKKVQFLSLDLSLQNMNASITAKTNNFQFLGEQILIIKEEELIESFNISNVALSKEGDVSFAINFNFKEDIFKNE